MQEDVQVIKILYTNWQGQTAIRRIIPKEIVFIATEWHPEEQWCLQAHDVDKDAERTFTMTGIKAWFVE